MARDRAVEPLPLTGAALPADPDPGIPGEAARPVCGLWIEATGPELRTAKGCRDLVDRLRALHATDAFVEVRTQGEALYRSELAPPAEGLDPAELDPLWELLKAAHAPGRLPIRIRAVVNLLRIQASGGTAEPALDHLLSLHPEWIAQDADGEVRDAAGDAWLDPGIPEVRAHLEAVVHELAARYPVDGLHFDGLRYPGERMDWGYNLLALAAFQASAGGDGAKPGPTNTVWAEWRAGQITDLLTSLTATVRQSRPGIEISVSALASGPPPAPDAPGAAEYQGALQPWPFWRQRGLVDALVLDNHDGKEEAGRFAQWLRLAAALPGRARLFALVSGPDNTDASLLELMQTALSLQADGVVLRSYQRPVRGGGAAELILDHLGETVFSPHYAVPTVTAQRLLDTSATLAMGGEDLPAPLPIAAAPAPGPRRPTQVDAVRALLGRPIAEPDYGASAPVEPGADLEGMAGPIGRPGTPAAIPAPPDPLEPIGPGWLRVRIRNGREFIAREIGVERGLTLYRLHLGGLVLKLEPERIESVTPLDSR